MPRATPEMYLETIDVVQGIFNKAGLTAHRTTTGTEDGLRALHLAAGNSKLTMHWGVGLDVNYLESTYSFDECMAQISNRKQYESEFVKADYAKIFIDGDLNGFGKLLSAVGPIRGRMMGLPQFDHLVSNVPEAGVRTSM